MHRKLKWQIPGEPLAARYNWCQGPVPGRSPAVEKHCLSFPKPMLLLCTPFHLSVTSAVTWILTALLNKPGQQKFTYSEGEWPSSHLVACIQSPLSMCWEAGWAGYFRRQRYVPSLRMTPWFLSHQPCGIDIIQHMSFQLFTDMEDEWLM